MNTKYFTRIKFFSYSNLQLFIKHNAINNVAKPYFSDPFLIDVSAIAGLAARNFTFQDNPFGIINKLLISNIYGIGNIGKLYVVINGNNQSSGIALFTVVMQKIAK